MTKVEAKDLERVKQNVGGGLVALALEAGDADDLVALVEEVLTWVDDDTLAPAPSSRLEQTAVQLSRDLRRVRAMVGEEAWSEIASEMMGGAAELWHGLREGAGVAVGED